MPLKLSRKEREPVLIEAPGHGTIRVHWERDRANHCYVIIVDAPASVIIRRPEFPQGAARRLARERMDRPESAKEATP